MATFMIGYDINSEGSNYSSTNSALIEKIRDAFPTWWHHLDSTWLVVTDKSASEIRDKLKPCLDNDDELLVMKSAGVGAWCGFNKTGSNWLKNNL